MDASTSTSLDGFGFAGDDGVALVADPGASHAGGSHDESIDMFEEPKEPSQSLASTMTIIYSFMKELWSKEPLSVQRKGVTNDFIKAVIAKSGIPIVNFPFEENDIKARYETIIDVVRKRFAHRLKIFKESRGRAKQDPNEIMFCLEGEDLLIDWERYLQPDTPPLSQESTTSSVRSSQLSEIEIDFKMPKPPTPETKDLEDLNSDYKREKMDELYKAVKDNSTKWKSSVKTTLCTLGRRFYYKPNRSLSNTFRDLEEGKLSNPAVMPLAAAAYFKTRFIKTQRKMKDVKHFLRPWIAVPADEQVQAYINDLTPAMERVEGFHGYKFDLKDAIQRHLNRLPHPVKAKMYEEYEKGEIVKAKVSTGMDG